MFSLPVFSRVSLSLVRLCSALYSPVSNHCHHSTCVFKFLSFTSSLSCHWCWCSVVVSACVQFSQPFFLSVSQSFRSCPVHPRFIINHLQFFTIHESCVWVTSSPPHDTNPDRMTWPVLRRHTWDSADSDLFERQEAALSRGAEELRRKQRLFTERECVFKGTRLALGRPWRRRGPPPAASPALEHRRGEWASQAKLRPLALPPLHSSLRPFYFAMPQRLRLPLRLNGGSLARALSCFR